MRLPNGRWILSGMLVGAALVAAGWTSGAPSDRASGRAGERDPLPEAIRHEQAGRYAEAAPLFEKAAGQKPVSEVSLLDRAGWNYLNAEKHREALRVFKSAAEKAPRFGNALDGLGIALFETRDLPGLTDVLKRRLSPEGRDRAVEIVTAGIAAPEGSLERSWALGYLHTQFGGGRAAGMKPLERVLALQPEHEEARRRLAGLLARCGLADESEAAWDEYLRRHPETPDAFAERARRAGKESPEAGLAVAEAGLKRHPDSESLYAVAGTLSARLPEPEGTERLRALLESAEKLSARVPALILRGQLNRRLLDRGRYAEAESLRKTLPRALRESPHGREEEAHLALAQGRVAPSLPLYRAALKTAETDPLASPARTNALRAMEALVLLAAGQREEAALALARLGERAGVSGDRSGPFPEVEALAYWLRWESTRKDSPQHRAGDEQALAMRWEKRPVELDEAARRVAAREIVRRYAACYPAHHMLARSLASTGEHAAAEASLQAARAARPSWWLPRWSLAGGYLQAKRFAEARSELQAARTLAPGLNERVEATLRALARRPPG